MRTLLIWMVLLVAVQAQERQFEFPMPVTNAVALQNGKRVEISITYTDQIPVRVCVGRYAWDDTDLVQMLDAPHCFVPDNIVSNIDIWENENLNQVNFLVMVTYPDGRTVPMALMKPMDT